MANPARIEDLMHFIDTDQGQRPGAKTASERVAPELSAALDNVMRELGGQQKVASAQYGQSPDNQLMKLAQEVVAIDRDGEVKHAQLVGASMADAFVARVGQWEAAAAAVDGNSKTASMDEGTMLAKFAAENPAAYDAAVRAGYSDARNMIEKAGQAAAEQGYQQKVAAIHETAARHYIHASQVMTEVAQALSAR